MTKPVRMLNKYHIKEMLLHGNPQYENFYKEELIQFCKIAQEELKKLNSNQEKAIKKINNIFFALSSNNKNYNNLYIKLVDTEQGKDLLNILQGGDK